jgi:hypothetical protein
MNTHNDKCLGKQIGHCWDLGENIFTLNFRDILQDGDFAAFSGYRHFKHYLMTQNNGG